jgi:hypothetical protein
MELEFHLFNFGKVHDHSIIGFEDLIRVDFV